MGLQIGDLVARKEVSLGELKGRVVAVDAFNALFQFLSSIRQQDGTPLMDSVGRVTSHLSGLFYRNVALLAEGMKLIYVFDGEYHVLKGKTHEKRQQAKDNMAEKYEVAVSEGDIDGMGKYSRAFMRLTPEMLAESKELLVALGIPVVQAPGEGEMQCAELVKSGQAYAVASQDYDALVVGGTRLIQNLTLARKRKTASGFMYIAPEMIEYERVLQELGIDGDQLICLAILVGTDFNPGGIKGIGPKKALALVKQYRYPVQLFGSLEGRMEFDWQEIFSIFKKPNVSRERVVFPKLNEGKLQEILVGRHEFSIERIENQLAKLRTLRREKAQQTLF